MISKVLAVIPARGGSKRIYKKNIRDVGGKPLIYYQIKNALDAKLVDHVVVATDSTEIADVVLGLFGNKIEIIMRPPEISHALSKTEETLLYVLARIDADIIVTLEPTNPLNQPQYVDECIQRILVDGYDSCCCALEDKGLFLDEEELLLKRPMWADIKPALREAGNCWATLVDTLRETNNRLGGKFGYIIVPASTAHHIDTEDDWHIVEALLQNRAYFTKADKSIPDYEEDYWGTVTDPDGKTRDRAEERDLVLVRHKEKIGYLNTLTGKIVDIGCGRGHLLSALSAKWEKHGVDISHLATEDAKKYGQIVCGTLLDAKYNDNYFDVALLVNVIEHVEDPVGLIRETRRILKPNGKLILETPDFGCGLAQRAGENFRLLKDPGHISLFNQFGVYRMLTDNLFEVVEVKYPYFELDLFNKENLMRLFDTSKISPPMLGSMVTFYTRKK